MKKLELTECTNVNGGDQCARLVRRLERAGRQGRVETRDRLFEKWQGLCE